MTAKTSIVLTSAKDALTLPYDCVETDADCSYYVTLEDGTKLTVEKGVESDYYVQVISDEISEGTKVQIPISSQTDTSSSDVVSLIMDSNGNRMDGGSMGGSGGGPADPADRVVCNMEETMIQLKGIRKSFYEGTANKAAKLNPIEALRYE